MDYLFASEKFKEWQRAQIEGRADIEKEKWAEVENAHFSVIQQLEHENPLDRVIYRRHDPYGFKLL